MKQQLFFEAPGCQSASDRGQVAKSYPDHDRSCL